MLQPDQPGREKAVSDHAKRCAEQAASLLRDATTRNSRKGVERALDQAKLAGNAAAALASRYFRVGDPADLEEAIEHARNAIVVRDVPAADLAMFLSILSALLHARFEQAGVRSDLDDAFELGSRAVALAEADDPNRPAYLSHLGNVLTSRHQLNPVLAPILR